MTQVIPGKVLDQDGTTRLEGDIELDGVVSADTINGVAINNTPSGAGEQLVTVNSANAAWQSGGGGFAIGSSYLFTDTLAQPGNASGATVTQQFGGADVAGADFSINGGDNTRIDVANDCWTILTYRALVFPETTTLTSVAWFLTVTGSAIGPHLIDNQVSEVITSDWYISTTAPVFLPAAATVRAKVICTTSAAGTWLNEAGVPGLGILRLA